GLPLGGLLLRQQRGLFVFQFAKLAPARGTERAPAHGCLAHGAHDIDFRRIAFADDTAVYSAVTGLTLQLPLDQIGQRQPLEQEIEKFARVQFKGEIIQPFTLVRRLAAIARATAGWPGDGVALLEFAVAGMHDTAAAAGAVMKLRLAEI